MAIIHAKAEDFDQIIASHPKILLNFWAEWCAPCRCFWPTLDQYAELENNGVQVVKVNVDKQKVLAERFKVKGIPNSLVIVNGDVKGMIAGIVSCDELYQRVESFITQQKREA
ncbi:thioredoxin 1 [Listeria floridensis FSL S10-1187]|uniref:Thioredoxin n=1 Tax=Listeria floridensis FSL S10-1187 TaxID=1265817 RepID=A0ABP3AWD1_9LIST|nr:thioredoxin family protein [Listeria floridensis]EUJ25651.1 thioredoxin 1 [Listeria floridensis FSL S10-1187]